MFSLASLLILHYVNLDNQYLVNCVVCYNYCNCLLTMFLVGFVDSVVVRYCYCLVTMLHAGLIDSAVMCYCHFLVTTLHAGFVNSVSLLSSDHASCGSCRQCCLVLLSLCGDCASCGSCRQCVMCYSCYLWLCIFSVYIMLFYIILYAYVMICRDLL